ncbi:hypothetical protein BU15DRAFT_68372, partial [Melanogaster broomeanus]
TCEAQFTRSDLLTRHKKTCGDPWAFRGISSSSLALTRDSRSHATRTRRRSCQACADSKVKCDLQQPCSKCQARGKRCMFIVPSSRASAVAMAQMPATVVERSPDPDNVATALVSAPPTLIPTTPNPHSASLRPDVPSDQLDQRSLNWTSSLAVHKPDAIRSHSGVPSPSPSESYSSGSASDAGPTVTSACIPSQNPLSSFYSNDFEPFFPDEISGYNNVVGSDNAHTPNDLSPIPGSASSPISSAEDTLAYITQGIEAQYQFQPTESLYYVPSSNQQQVVAPTEQLQRQRYVQDHYTAPFSGPINTIRQQASEQQHYRRLDTLDPSTFTRTRTKAHGPYEGYPSTRRVLLDGRGSQLHFEYVDADQGDSFGRVYEKVTRHPASDQARISSSVPANHRLPIPLGMERTDALEDLSLFVSADDQTYRPGLPDCFVDSIRWNGLHAMRHQPGIDLS